MPDCNCVESPARSHRSCGPSERGRTGQPPAAGWGRGPCVPGERCRQLDYLPAANGLHADVAPRRRAHTPAEGKHPGRFRRPRRSCAGQRPHRARSPGVQLPGLATAQAGPAQARRMGRTASSAASDRRLGRTWRQAAATLHRRQDRGRPKRNRRRSRTACGITGDTTRARLPPHCLYRSPRSRQASRRIPAGCRGAGSFLTRANTGST